MNYKFKRRIALIAFLIYVLDSISKILALHFLANKDFRIIGNFLQLKLATNFGAAFSIGYSHGFLLALISFLVICVIFFFARKLNNLKIGFPMGLMLGGALGNLADRLFRAPYAGRGSIVDWIWIPHFSVFNLADIALSIGGIWLVLALLISNSAKS